LLDVKGPHPVVYNPADKLCYANDTENNRLIAFSDLSKPEIAAKPDSMQDESLFLGLFNRSNPGEGDAILRLINLSE
jgi:hypothetical protein